MRIRPIISPAHIVEELQRKSNQNFKFICNPYLILMLFISLSTILVKPRLAFYLVDGVLWG